MLSKPGALTVGHPGDSHEREADRVSERVMGTPAGAEPACGAPAVWTASRSPPATICCAHPVIRWTRAPGRSWNRVSGSTSAKCAFTTMRMPGGLRPDCLPARSRWAGTSRSARASTRQKRLRAESCWPTSSPTWCSMHKTPPPLCAALPFSRDTVKTSSATAMHRLSTRRLPPALSRTTSPPRI